ncbi:hypothetical protein [Jannaschia aquimarina]|uniref:Uncharacterized protein n=1 Tax=Jannaschia aquimarina TaxID=935700 RepID=A0A0D1CHK8_9RHOB|nr:hypothetical protein [Jannaschia aquimarina]KIT14187.1 hypothetical protein jaqu_39790 [Jannaschia aquimarina]SNS47659.1 hypothetical protein SAMN05421775_10199 [Jannaschia aquimarina]
MRKLILAAALLVPLQVAAGPFIPDLGPPIMWPEPTETTQSTKTGK